MSKKLSEERTLEKMTADFINFFDSSKCKSGLDLAQGIMSGAWEIEDSRKRIDLAHKALALSPECADAYILLAEESGGSADDALVLFRKAAKAAAQGIDVTVEAGALPGRFPGTHPYVRATLGIARSLWKLERFDEAVTHYREALRLDRSDEHGVRYILAACLAELQRFDELMTHLNSKEFANDCTADWFYTKALISFIRYKDCDESRVCLLRAFESNRHIPPYLSGDKQIPQHLPNIMVTGSEEEAMCYAADFAAIWRQVPAALEWLKKFMAMAHEQPGERNT